MENEKIYCDTLSKVTEILTAFDQGNLECSREKLLRIFDNGEKSDSAIKRELSRKLKLIKEEYYIDIKLYRSNNVYKIVSTEENEERFYNLFSALEKFEVSNQILASFKFGEKFKDIIQFDSSAKNIETTGFKHIIQAIKDNKKISFKYKGFNDDEKIVTVSPYFLKESSYRWYIIGLKNDDEKRTYNLDRIIGDVEIREETFEIDQSKIDSSDEFSDMIGITKTDPRNDYKIFDKKEIHFQIKGKLRKLIEELPIHDSQEIVKEKDEYTTYKVYLRDNYEFLNKLYSYIPFVRVTYPEDVKEKFYNELRETLDGE